MLDVLEFAQMKNSDNFDSHLDNWSISGLSKAAYCRQAQISYHTFLYYFKKRSRTNPKGFVRINTPLGSDSENRIAYYFQGELKISFPSNYPIEQLRKLLEC